MRCECHPLLIPPNAKPSRPRGGSCGCRLPGLDRRHRRRRDRRCRLARGANPGRPSWIVATARRLGKLVAVAARGVAGRVTEWWRQRKPFQTAGGESHQVYFEGDERSPRPMVASRDPRPVTYRLDEFDRKARDSAATDAQRAAASLISATRTALASNPDDPIIVTNLRTLFGLFDDPVRP